MASNEYMQKYISVINILQEISNRMDTKAIQLPQIAVVGIQSSGKSSVLEKFVGRDILPRGSDIVTRTPLVLQLITSDEEYGKFSHIPEKFTNFEEIKLEIQRATDKIAGLKKCVSEKPIILKIFSPNVLNLTLVDLPGITKVSVDGQPSDIEYQIKKMILNYISQETCLILAVSPANIDLANSEALKLAQQVDPQGLRTIGVITKLDLMDQGTNAVNILNNKIIPLKRGYIGVVNRSQKNINDGKTIQTATEDEANFFENHPDYCDMRDRLGTKFLQKNLSEQLSQHIAENLPALKTSIKVKCEEYRKIVKELDDDKSENPMKFTKMWKELRDRFDAEIYGNTSKINKNCATPGVAIHNLFTEKILNGTLEITPLANEEILTVIRNSKGYKNQILTSGNAFQSVVKYAIDQTEEPLMNHAHQVSNVLQQAFEVLSEVFSPYPPLKSTVREITLHFIQKSEAICKEKLLDLINEENDFYNTRHPEFIGSLTLDKQIEELQTAESLNVAKPSNFLRKGFLKIVDTPASTIKIYFLLTTQNIQGFSRKKSENLEFEISTKNLGVSLGKGKVFKLVHTKGNIIYKDMNSIWLKCKNEKESAKWISSLEAAGVTQKILSPMTSVADLRDIPPQTGKIEVEKESCEDHATKSQVEKIRQLTETFLKTVDETFKDRIPKIISYHLVTSTKRFIDGDILAYLYKNNLLDQLMERSEIDIAKANEAKKMLEACQNALEAIDDIITNKMLH